MIPGHCFHPNGLYFENLWRQKPAGPYFGKQVDPLSPTRSAVEKRKKLAALQDWAARGIGESHLNRLGLLASVSRVAKSTRWMEAPDMSLTYGLVWPWALLADLLAMPFRPKPAPDEPDTAFPWSYQMLQKIRLYWQGQVAPWEVLLCPTSNGDIKGVLREPLLMAMEALGEKGLICDVVVGKAAIGYALTPLGEELLAFSKSKRSGGKP